MNALRPILLAATFLLAASRVPGATTTPLPNGYIVGNGGHWAISDFGCSVPPYIHVEPSPTFSQSHTCTGLGYTVSGNFTVNLPQPEPATITVDDTLPFPNNHTFRFDGDFPIAVTASGTISIAPDPEHPDRVETAKLFASVFPTDPIDPATDPNCTSIDTCQYNDVKAIGQGKSASFSVDRTRPIRSVYAFESDEVVGGVTMHGWYFYIDALIQLDINGLKIFALTSAKYFYPESVDQVSISNPDPSEGSVLSPDSNRSFEADVTYKLGSHDQGFVALRLYDQDQTLLGSSDFIAIQKDQSQTIRIAIDELRVPKDATRLRLRANIYDQSQSQVLIKSSPIEYPVSPCALSGYLRRSAGGQVYWLPGASVELLRVDSGGLTPIAEVQARAIGTASRPESDYCFDLPGDFDFAKTYRIRVRLQDALTTGSPQFLVARTAKQGTDPRELLWQPFLVVPGVANRRDLDVDREKDLDVVDPDQAEAAAEIYFHIWRMVHVLMPAYTTAPMSRNLPLEIFLDGTEDSHYCATDLGICPVPSSIELETVDSIRGANPTVVWHEFGHHLIRELCGADEKGRSPIRPAPSADPLLDANHAGFSNDWTSASMDEGFATFWGVVASGIFELDRGRPLFRWNEPSPTSSKPLDLDGNFLAVELASGPAVVTDEELAVAGLLWDLVDSRVDPLVQKNGLTYGDVIAIDVADVLSVFQTAKPGTMFRFHDALAARFPDLATAPLGGLSPIDQLFLLHGFFRDDGDYSCEPGETVARAANGAPWVGWGLDSAYQPVPKTIPSRPARENLPQVPGAHLDLTFVDEEGRSLAAADVEISIAFPDGLTDLNSIERLRVTDGSLYLQMPPPAETATATIAVPGSTSAPFIIDNATYWQSVGRNPVLGSHTFVVPWSATASVPGLARAPGVAGSFFRSALWLTNPSDEWLRVRLRYVPAPGYDLGGGAEFAFADLAPHETQAWSDLLGEAFGASSATVGTVVVAVPLGTENPRAMARTYNDAGSAGTYGQFIGEVPAESSTSGTAWIHGLGADAASRTNLGILNPGSSELTALVFLHSPQGFQVGNPVTVTVPPRTSVQTSRINEAAGAGSLPVFSARIASTSPYFAYASKLDNQTSDPIFIPSTLVPRGVQWIDGLAAASGLLGTLFRSNLSITNPGLQPVEVSLAFRKRNESAIAATATVTLAARESKYWTNAVGELFALDGVAGQVTITSGSETPVVAWARTYNDLGAGGTFGQFIPAFGPEDRIGPEGARLPGISQDDRFRTNVGFLNTTASATSVTASILAADGTSLATKTWALTGKQAIFISKIANDLGISSISNGTLVVVPAASDAVYAWSSVVDNTSSDQIFVRPLP